MGLFSFIGSAVGGILSLVSGGSKKSGTTQTNFTQQFNTFKNEITSQMNLQAQENKKTLMMVLAGAGFLLVIMFFFLKK